ncbi:hypothetical protein [Bacillus massilinigeriensis]|uniref:hypothetical protein n=1 Tax=Bacillus massilionigeriensis TaxID=1805475 RepID=UPI00114D40DD|nr:hypothetical protein [Bacillus massilionigeriensis]
MKVDESRCYQNVDHALIEMGFRKRGRIVLSSAYPKRKPTLYEKNGELFYYIGMVHFNESIKSIKLRKVKSISNKILFENFI